MSTNFFANFRPIYYDFGDEASQTLFQNMTQYVDIVDQVKENDAFFEDYTVMPEERPDHVSMKLYGSPEYYWTFFMMNDHIRESGWPKTNYEILDYCKEAYPHRMVTTKDNIAAKGLEFEIGQQVTGGVSDTVGTIVLRRLDLGQLIIDTTSASRTVPRTLTIQPNANGIYTQSLSDTRETYINEDTWVIRKGGASGDVQSDYTITLNPYRNELSISNLNYTPGDNDFFLEYQIKVTNPTDSSFNVGEDIQYVETDDGLSRYANVLKESPQYEGVHHYEDASGNIVDIDPLTQVIPSNYTAVSFYDVVYRRNEELRKIKVLKPSAVQQIAKQFAEAMNE